MTIAADTRATNRKNALLACLGKIGSGRCNERFRVDDVPDILPTTWQDMEDKGWLERIHPKILYYRLTRAGYLEALEESGKVEDESFKSELGKVCSALKAHIQGRTDKATINPSAVAKQAGGSEAFLFNAIECQLIEHVFKRKGARWFGQPSMKGLAITVPINFSHTLDEDAAFGYSSLDRTHG